MLHTKHMHMYKKLLIGLIMFMLFDGCAPANKITYTWTNPSFKTSKPYKKIFLAALVNNPHVRTHLEEEMWLTAKANGFAAERSWDYFPPSFSKPTPPNREMMMKEITRLECDLIFTITLTDRKSETRYVPGSLGMYGPFSGYGLQFRGFYSYWYPYAYDPGYYVTDRTYFMEGNLFDTETETLIWSIQTKTMNPGSVEKFSKELIETMLNKSANDLKNLQNK
jgi:hypothetical protein